MLGPLDDYLTRLLYSSTRVPLGLFRSANAPNTPLQLKFFEALLDQCGFTKTRLQFYLPGQTAGLIKKIEDGNELHVRFYDATDELPACIDVETEYGRFHPRHLDGEHVHDPAVLDDLLKGMHGFSIDEHEALSSLFMARDYSSLFDPPVAPYCDMVGPTKLSSVCRGLSYGVPLAIGVDALVSVCTGVSVLDVVSNRDFVALEQLTHYVVGLGQAYGFSVFADALQFGTTDLTEIGKMRVMPHIYSDLPEQMRAKNA